MRPKAEWAIDIDIFPTMNRSFNMLKLSQETAPLTTNNVIIRNIITLDEISLISSFKNLYFPTSV